MHQASLIGGLLLLGSIAVAIFRTGRVPQSTVHLVATNLWELDHLCRATGTIQRLQPAPKRVAIDLSKIPYLDDSGMASLTYACARWTKAGAFVTIEGCSRAVADAMCRRNVMAKIECRPCLEDSASSRTLH